MSKDIEKNLLGNILFFYFMFYLVRSLLVIFLIAVSWEDCKSTD